MTSAEPRSDPAAWLARPPPFAAEPCPPMLAGGGTTCAVRVPTPFLPRELAEAPEALGGGGTGFVRKSPVAELPQLLRSRLTCEGGGATTAGAGSVSLDVDDTSRCGAETGGATTSTVCVSGTRELARSRCASRGAGAMTLGASGFALRILSRETLGVGGTISAFKVGELRLLDCETSGAGGMTLVARLALRLSEAFTSGAGGTGLIAGRTGATREERSPSAGGGPGFGLNASRLATAASECGRLSLGASTTVSRGWSPRATRMVCVR